MKWVGKSQTHIHYEKEVNDNRISKGINKASITYETALVLPLFIGVLIFFLSFFKLMEIQEILSSAAYYVAEETSLYGFIYNNYSDEEDKTDETDKVNKEVKEVKEDKKNKEDEKNKEVSLNDVDSTKSLQMFLINSLQQIADKVASSLYFKYRMSLMLAKNQVNSNFIKDGLHGISYAGSEVLSEDLVIIKFKYYFKIPIFQNLIPTIEVVQSVIIRSFTGHYVPLKNTNDNNEDEEQKVYIAETGNVYHIDRNCTYIKLSIKEEIFSEIQSKRSENNSIYHECSLCKGQEIINNTVYVTDYGNRYHAALSCSGIKRSVTMIKLSEAVGKRPCSKCVATKTE